MSEHTPGPWRWEINRTTKCLELVGGGRRQYDLTVMGLARWGVNGAIAMFRDLDYPNRQVLHKVHERQDWIAPFALRKHHEDWLAGVVHPDAMLIEASPDLLAVVEEAIRLYGKPGGPWNVPSDPGGWMDRAQAAVAKARGTMSSMASESSEEEER